MRVKIKKPVPESVNTEGVKRRYLLNRIAEINGAISEGNRSLADNRVKVSELNSRISSQKEYLKLQNELLRQYKMDFDKLKNKE
jgi:hypothetical protein